MVQTGTPAVAIVLVAVSAADSRIQCMSINCHGADAHAMRAAIEGRLCRILRERRSQVGDVEVVYPSGLRLTTSQCGLVLDRAYDQQRMRQIVDTVLRGIGVNEETVLIEVTTEEEALQSLTFNSHGDPVMHTARTASSGSIAAALTIFAIDSQGEVDMTTTNFDRDNPHARDLFEQGVRHALQADDTVGAFGIAPTNGRDVSIMFLEPQPVARLRAIYNEVLDGLDLDATADTEMTMGQLVYFRATGKTPGQINRRYRSDRRD